ncbi:T9SS type A sorting domain-containing protein [uncultured Winogradskyella sp.]|uniref:T9SS type A sorting domain-containing protein n=1 Tax=uncultured Winogradskyella sp. TaxID=395353 RepID=UPI002602AE8B|nr:T9SS type A sorting domain-containing protein [uncultured Winogradskyella sp.]
MKKIYLLLVIFAFLTNSWSQEYMQMIAKGTYSVQEIQAEAEAYFNEVGRERGKGYKPYKRWEATALLMMDENGMLKSPDYYLNVLEEYNTYQNENSNSFARTTVGTWEDLGPTSWTAAPNGYNPGVGRISALDVQPSDPNHMIVGSPTGGVWRTTDGGSNWTVLTDNLSNLVVGSLTIHPTQPSIYYWGTNFGVIFRSLNSGATWNVLGDIGNGVVNKIIVDPTSTSKLYCSAQGGGIYKSTNSGFTWSIIHPNATNGYDVEFKPGDPSVVYASGTSVFRSTDGGNSFAEVGAPFDSGPKMIGVAEGSTNSSNQSYVYVLEASGGIFNQIYRSTNSGLSFSAVNTETKNYFGYASDGSDDLGQAPRDMDVVVSSSNANDVFIAGINTWYSNNGGATFTITSQWIPGNATNQNIGYCHADVDILRYVNGELYVGSDGGVYKAANPTTINSNYYSDLTDGISNRQFYRIGVSQTNPVVVVGGSQDNGSSVLRTDGIWYEWFGADGGESLVDKDDADIIYGSTQFGNFIKSDDAGQSIIGVTAPEDKGGQNNWNFFSTPFEQDPIDSNTVYIAFDEVYKSIDGGASWTSLSDDLFSSNISALKIAPSNNDYIYVSLSDRFWRTTDGGTTWSEATNYPGGSIVSIAVHPTDPDRVAVTSSFGNKVYVTTDSGVTWIPYGFDLPFGFTPLSLVWDDNPDNGLYLGMNYGVYYTDDTIVDSWIPFNNNLPNVIIYELEINYATNKIYAGTHGRGLWASDTYDSTLSTNDFELNEVSLFPNPANNEINIKWSNPEDVSIRVYNTLGKLMSYHKKISLLNGFKIDMTSFNSGVYYVKLNSSKGEITKKLILK